MMKTIGMLVTFILLIHSPLSWSTGLDTSSEVTPPLKLEKLIKLKNGNYHLTFHDGAHYLVLEDNDGMATLVVIHHLLVQSMSRHLYEHPAISRLNYWDTYQQVRSPQWPLVKPMVKEALAKLRSIYASLAAEESEYQERVNEIDKRLVAPAFLPNGNPMLKDLNWLLGRLITLYGQDHYYSVHYYDPGESEPYLTQDEYILEEDKEYLIGHTLSSGDIVLHGHSRFRPMKVVYGDFMEILFR